VGDVGRLPEIPANDIDIVVEPGHLSKCKAYIDRFAAERGGKLVQVLRHESCAFYHVIWLPRQNASGLFVKIDICSDYVRRGRKFLDAAWMLAGRRKINKTSLKAVFYVAAPDREFTYYLMKKVDKGSATHEALEHLAQLFSEAREPCRTVALKFCSVQTLDSLISTITSRDPDAFASVARIARAEVEASLPSPSLLDRAREWRRRIERILFPTGFVVAILGPDGAGKSTVLSALARQLEEAGRGSAVHHLFPRFGKSHSAPIVVDPHGKAPRGFLASVAKLAYLVLRYNCGWARSVFWQRRRSTLIFFDRYYDDLLADPARYRNGAPNWLVGAFGVLIPKPDLVLVLDAAPEVVRSRKIEVSQQESERQFIAYRNLANQLPRAQLIDASQQPEKVIAQCERAIVDALAERVKQRINPSCSDDS
jgi:thymidylate kinase